MYTYHFLGSLEVGEKAGADEEALLLSTQRGREAVGNRGRGMSRDGGQVCSL